jgi:hypothetical protein
VGDYVAQLEERLAGLSAREERQRDYLERRIGELLPLLGGRAARRRSRGGARKHDVNKVASGEEPELLRYTAEQEEIS